MILNIYMIISSRNVLCKNVFYAYYSGWLLIKSLLCHFVLCYIKQTGHGFGVVENILCICILMGRIGTTESEDFL